MKNLIKSLVLITTFASMPISIVAKHTKTTRQQSIIGCDQSGKSNGMQGSYNRRNHTASLTGNDKTTVKYTNVSSRVSSRSKRSPKNKTRFAYYQRRSGHKKNSSNKKTYLYGTRITSAKIA